MRAYSRISPIIAAGLLAAASAAAQAQGVAEALRDLRPSAYRIVGGLPAPADAARWQVYIEIPVLESGRSASYMCGGW